MRILLAGTGSGCGKTTASLLLMAVLKAQELDVAPCKVGPDYIDPGFHRAVCGRPSYNLDSWIMTEDESPDAVEDSDAVVLEDGRYMRMIREE